MRLIDKSDHAARWSQALVVQARTLEQWERYGLAGEAVARGRIVTGAHLHHDTASLACVELSRHIPGRYPFLLCLPQNDTEQILMEHARTLGVEIERNVELTALSNTVAGDGVEAHLQHASGQKEHVTFRFLLGCDGAHSTVRKATNTPFEGEAVGQRFALGDLRLQGEGLPNDELSLYFHRGGFGLFVLLLPSGFYRVISIFPAETQSTSAGPLEMSAVPTLETFNADFQRFGLSWQAVEAAWLSPFRVNERKAKQYRHGNVFLLGDAAHIHSPAGGQGMNTGIQDAANLAWKLRAVLNGAPEALLDTYDEERGAVAREVLRGSGLALRGAGLSHTVSERLRDWAVHQLLETRYVQEAVAHAVSETGISYRGSRAVADFGPHEQLCAGDRMPDAELADGCALLAPLQKAQHLLIAVGMPHNDVPRALRDTAVLELGPHDPHWIQSLPINLGHTPSFYAVRPDGYIGYRGPAGDLLHAYARRVGML